MTEHLESRVAVLERGLDLLNSQNVAGRLAALEANVTHTSQGVDRVEAAVASMSGRITQILALVVTIILGVVGIVVSMLGAS